MDASIRVLLCVFASLKLNTPLSSSPLLFMVCWPALSTSGCSPYLLLSGFTSQIPVSLFFSYTIAPYCVASIVSGFFRYSTLDTITRGDDSNLPSSPSKNIFRFIAYPPAFFKSGLSDLFFCVACIRSNSLWEKRLPPKTFCNVVFGPPIRVY